MRHGGIGPTRTGNVFRFCESSNANILMRKAGEDMKANRSIPCPPSSSQQSRARSAIAAFTLIELMVVIAVIAMLAALLLPALAGARADTAKAQCQSNMKQLGIGFRLFEQDHSEMFPPAGDSGSGPISQLVWDTYLHRYIGGTVSDASLGYGVIDVSTSPKVEICPAAPDRVINWAVFQGEELFSRRTYSMVGCSEYFQAAPGTGVNTYSLSKGTSLGAGVYWDHTKTGQPADWDAKSFKTALVDDPAGTLLLVEQSENMNMACNIWPCISLGVADVSLGAKMLCQMDSTAALPAQGGGNVNVGKFLYANHGYRFNYLFHDGHVEMLTTNATVGSGTLSSPKGMWTIKVGD